MSVVLKWYKNEKKIFSHTLQPQFYNQLATTCRLLFKILKSAETYFEIILPLKSAMYHEFSNITNNQLIFQIFYHNFRDGFPFSFCSTTTFGSRSLFRMIIKKNVGADVLSYLLLFCQQLQRSFSIKWIFYLPIRQENAIKPKKIWLNIDILLSCHEKLKIVFTCSW